MRTEFPTFCAFGPGFILIKVCISTNVFAGCIGMSNRPSWAIKRDEIIVTWGVSPTDSWLKATAGEVTDFSQAQSFLVCWFCKFSRFISTTVFQKANFAKGKGINQEWNLGLLKTWVDIYVFTPCGKRRGTRFCLKYILLLAHKLKFSQALCQQPSDGFHLTLTWSGNWSADGRRKVVGRL